MLFPALLAPPLPGVAQTQIPALSAEPLRLVFFDGSSLRGADAATPAEQALFDRLHRLADQVTLVEEPLFRAEALFTAHRYDCLIDLRFDATPALPGTLSSRPQMRIDYRYYHLAGAALPPAGAARVARNRRMADWPAVVDGSPYAELVAVNDLRQSIDLLKAHRVDYALVYTGNMETVPEVRTGEVVPVPGLPPARTATVRISCYDSPRARQLIDRLDAMTPADAVSQ